MNATGKAWASSRAWPWAGRGDVDPAEASLVGQGSRSARFWFAPVDGGENEREAAIVYVIDTTEQRALQEQFTQSQKMHAVGQLAGGGRA